MTERQANAAGNVIEHESTWYRLSSRDHFTASRAAAMKAGIGVKSTPQKIAGRGVHLVVLHSPGDADRILDVIREHDPAATIVPAPDA